MKVKFVLLGLFVQLLLVFPAFADGMEYERRSNVQPTQMLNSVELRKYQYCSSDKDCVYAINGCCDCANGGVETAVNKAEYDRFRKNFQCRSVVCGGVLDTPVCGSGVVSCINHQCNYYSEEDFRVLNGG